MDMMEIQYTLSGGSLNNMDSFIYVKLPVFIMRVLRSCYIWNVCMYELL